MGDTIPVSVVLLGQVDAALRDLQTRLRVTEYPDLLGAGETFAQRGARNVSALQYSEYVAVRLRKLLGRSQ